MEIETFKEKLSQMTIPDVGQLKHQEMLANAISNAKDKSVLSWWWLSIPLYITAALLMKTFFMPQTTFIKNIREFIGQEKYAYLLVFLVLPIVFIVINFSSIRKIYFLSGSPKTINFLQEVWFNIFIIICSILILIIYSL